MARGVIGMGGASLAEHGVGRSSLKQSLLLELYGQRGIDEMRAFAGQASARSWSGKLSCGGSCSQGQTDYPRRKRAI